MNNIYNLTFDEIEKFIIENNEKKYRAAQIFEWLHKNKIININGISNISNELKQKIVNNFSTDFPEIYEEYISSIDDTKKYLIKLVDGNIIESVLMKYKYGYTICISSEVGCDMGCKFCASTIGGMKRNLDVYELLAQIYLIENKNNINVSNIVIMGSGEPLLNLDNIIKFFDIINSEKGKKLSLRNITLSTCGIVPNIYKLATYNFPITLALSLHAPTNEIRRQIMPIANKYSIEETMEAMKNYFLTTNRRITFEYCLIDGVNDNVVDAKNLIKLFNKSFYGFHIDFNINLINVNNIKERTFKRPNSLKMKNFYNVILENGFHITIRRELGADISGSCGQLRARKF